MQEAAEEDNVMRSSSQSDSTTDLDDDEDYEPEALYMSKQESRSCSASEEQGGKQSRDWDDAWRDPSDWAGRQREQSKVRLLLQQTHLVGQMCTIYSHTHAVNAYTLALLCMQLDMRFNQLCCGVVLQLNY